MSTAQQAAYISLVTPYAIAQQRRTGIPAEVMIVQSGVETGWGTSNWFKNANNPAGIGVTGAPGAGMHYDTLAQGFQAYADKLMGHGEAGQQTFVADVRAGATAPQLLTDLQNSPWAAGHYGYHSLVDTYGSLYSGVPTARGQNVPGYAPGGDYGTSGSASGVETAGLGLPSIPFSDLLKNFVASPLSGPLGSFAGAFDLLGKATNPTEWFQGFASVILKYMFPLAQVLGGMAFLTIGIIIVLVDTGAMSKMPVPIPV